MDRRLLVALFVLALAVAALLAFPRAALHSTTTVDIAWPKDAAQSTPTPATELRDATPVASPSSRSQSEAHGPLGPAAIGQEPASDTWQMLKQHADAGDTTAACKLSLQLQGCRRATELSRSIDADVERVAASDATADEDATTTRLADNQQELAAYSHLCGNAPADVALHEWRYLLDAALAGHEPSMYRFAMFPPIDASKPLEYAEAIAAYRTYAPRFIDELVNRGSAEGLLVAYLVAGGQPIVGESQLRPPDATKMLTYAAALATLRNRPVILESAIGNARNQLTRTEMDGAIATGRAMIGRFRFRFLENGQVSVMPSDRGSSCERDWSDRDAVARQ